MSPGVELHGRPARHIFQPPMAQQLASDQMVRVWGARQLAGEGPQDRAGHGTTRTFRPSNQIFRHECPSGFAVSGVIVGCSPATAETVWPSGCVAKHMVPRAQTLRGPGAVQVLLQRHWRAAERLGFGVQGNWQERDREDGTCAPASNFQHGCTSGEFNCGV